MRRIRIPNPVLDKNYRTFLTADYSSGTSLTVESTVSFATSDFLVAGEPREEKTELRQISGAIPSDTSININSAFRFTHSSKTPIYKSYWDFISIERRTSSAGVFAEISQSAIQWDNKLNETVYFDGAATSAYEYRFRYYNSSTGLYSEYSPTLSGAAPDRNTVRYMMSRVRELLSDQEKKIITDDEIIMAFNEAQDIIYTNNPKYFFLYVDTYELGSGSIAATASEDVYSLANLSRFGHLAGIKYKYTSGSTNEIYRLRKIDEAEFDRLDSNQNVTPMDWPTVFKLLPADSSSDNGYFKVTPDILSTGLGTFYPLYYEKMANLDSVEDETQVPLPDLLIKYATGYGYQLAGNETKSKVYQSVLVNFTDNPRAVPPGLAMLDKMDNYQKEVVGQPKSLWKFRGQKALRRLYGNKFSGISLDYLRENYF